MVTEQQILDKTYQLIDTKEKWTQDSLARSGKGHPISYTAKGASQFCLLGALKRATWELLGCSPDSCQITEETYELYSGARKRLGDLFPGGAIGLSNDFREYKEIIEILNTARGIQTT